MLYFTVVDGDLMEIYASIETVGFSMAVIVSTGRPITVNN